MGIQVDVNLVLVPVTVTDSRGQVVTGLRRDDFTVLEDKVPQPIVSFSGEDAPTSVGLVVDLSRSMRKKMRQARSAVRTFLKTANPADELLLVTFAERPQLQVGFTQDLSQVQHHLLFAAAKGKTALNDAIFLALRQMRSARRARKALLVVSDGGENGSRYTKKELLAAAMEADVQIHALILSSYRLQKEQRRGRMFLKKLSRMTGGRSFEVRRLRKLDKAAAKVRETLHEQYLISYRSPESPLEGKWRRIQIKLDLPRRGARVYFRRGYYPRQQLP